jgi:hypothetical protein
LHRAGEALQAHVGLAESVVGVGEVGVEFRRGLKRLNGAIPLLRRQEFLATLILLVRFAPVLDRRRRLLGLQSREGPLRAAGDADLFPSLAFRRGFGGLGRQALAAGKLP